MLFLNYKNAYSATTILWIPLAQNYRMLTLASSSLLPLCYPSCVFLELEKSRV